MKPRLAVAALTACVTLSTSTLSAQSSLSDKVAELIKFGTCSQALCLVTGPGIHQTHFLESATLASTELSEFLTHSITSSVGRLPVSATSSGTSFSFVNGAPVQTNSSAGPIFAERAATLGQKRLLIGVNYSAISFSKLRGQSINDVAINLAHQDVGEPGLGTDATEGDVVGIDLNMKLDLQVASLSATYGVNDRLDLSIAVPFVSASFDATGAARVFNPTGTVTGLHTFGTASSPSLTAASAVSGSSSGIGDIRARAKLNLKKTTNSGLALLADIHLPTGDDTNFQGSGNASGDAVLIASTTMGNFSPHANVGFAMRSGEGQNSALLGTFGFDHRVNKQATIAVDLLSEFQAGGDSGKLPADIVLAKATPPRTVQGTNIPSQKDNPIALSAGGRFLVSGYTLTANGVVPVKSGGMQAKLIWTLGVERSF